MEFQNQKVNYVKLNLDTKVTTNSLEKIHVAIDPKVMIGNFAQSYRNELRRRNFEKYDSDPLTVEEFNLYFQRLVKLRIMSVEDDCPDWRQARQLYIPSWIEAVISMLGKVVDTERGMVIIPSFELEWTYRDKKIDGSKGTIDEMLDFSLRLGSFREDGLVLHKDAFPRVPDGDKDVMMMAIIDGYVKSQLKVAHPIAGYIAGFLGMKLQQEQTFKLLYRVRYDDINYITEMLLREEMVLA